MTDLVRKYICNLQKTKNIENDKLQKFYEIAQIIEKFLSSMPYNKFLDIAKSNFFWHGNGAINPDVYDDRSKKQDITVLNWLVSNTDSILEIIQLSRLSLEQTVEIISQKLENPGGQSLTSLAATRMTPTSDTLFTIQRKTTSGGLTEEQRDSLAKNKSTIQQKTITSNIQKASTAIREPKSDKNKQITPSIYQGTASKQKIYRNRCWWLSAKCYQSMNEIILSDLKSLDLGNEFIEGIESTIREMCLAYQNNMKQSTVDASYTIMDAILHRIFLLKWHKIKNGPKNDKKIKSEWTPFDKLDVLTHFELFSKKTNTMYCVMKDVRNNQHPEKKHAFTTNDESPAMAIETLWMIVNDCKNLKKNTYLM